MSTAMGALAVMAAPHKSKRGVKLRWQMAARGVVGGVVVGNDPLAVAAAVMAADEARRIGRTLRGVAKSAKAAEARADQASALVEAIQARESAFTVGGALDEWLTQLERASVVALDLAEVAEVEALTLATLAAYRAAWLGLVVMPDEASAEAYPTQAAYEWAKAATRTKARRVSLPNGYVVTGSYVVKDGTRYVMAAAPRVELEWVNDATRDALDGLRRAVLKATPIRPLRDSSPHAHNHAATINRDAVRKSRRAKRRAAKLALLEAISIGAKS